MNDCDWILELKVGDPVYLSQPYSQPPCRGKVLRITATRIMVSGRVTHLDGSMVEYAFHKKTGWSVGGGTYHKEHLIRATPEMDAKHMGRIANERAKSCLKHLAESNFDMDKAKAIIAWCKEMMTGKSEEVKKA